MRSGDRSSTSTEPPSTTYSRSGRWVMTFSVRTARTSRSLAMQRCW